MNIKTKALATAVAVFGSISANANILPDWHGFWQGSCQYDAQDGTPTETIPLTIEITPVSATEVTWNMHYMRASGDIVKNYILRAVDETTGHYVIDENNGILIDEYLLQNQLMAQFEVNKRQITIASELEGNTLNYNSYAFSTSVERRNRGANGSVLVYGEPSLEACTLTR